MNAQTRYQLEDVREAESAARAVQLADLGGASAAELASLRAEVHALGRRLHAAEVEASGLAARKAIKVAEATRHPGLAISRFRERVGTRRQPDASDGSSMQTMVYPQGHLPLFSVVLPVFNNGSTLMAALESVRRQTLPDWEVVLWDDGSTDAATIALIDGLKLPGVRIFRELNGGVVAARNRAMREVRGRFTIMLDPDDTIEPTYLEKALIVFLRNPDAGIVVPMTRVSGEDGQMMWWPPSFTEEVVSYENVAPIATAFRTELWDRVGGMTHELDQGFEDWGFWRSLAAQGCQAATLPEPLFRYTHSETTGRDAAARRTRDDLELRVKQMFPTVDRARHLTGQWVPLGNALEEHVFHIPTGGRQPLVIFVPWMMRGGGAESFLLTAVPGLLDEFEVVVIATQPLPDGFRDCKPEFFDVTPYVYDLSILVGEEDYPAVVRSILYRLVNPTILVVGSAWAYAHLAEMRDWVRGRPRVVDLHFNHVGHVGRLLAGQHEINHVLAAHGRLRSLLVDYYCVEPPVDIIHIAPPLAPLAHGEAEMPRGRLHGRLRVGWLGRNSPEKRLDLASAVARAAPHIDLVVAGAGVDDFARSGALPGNMEVVGWVDDPRRFIASCDLLLNTSDVEGISL
ncbi:MAG TPA: glycosyltransferase, partial [Actinomycetota bacterium]|nr:glycosyltransferase [Actinomycetota bacterium]